MSRWSALALMSVLGTQVFASQVLNNLSTDKVERVRLEKRVLVNLDLLGEPDSEIIGEGDSLTVDNTNGFLEISIGDSAYKTEVESSYAKVKVTALKFNDREQRYFIEQFNRETPRSSKWYPVQHILINVDRKAKKARVWVREYDDTEKKLLDWSDTADFGVK